MPLEKLSYTYFTPPEMEVNYLSKHIRGFNKTRLNNVYDVIFEKSNYQSVLVDSISEKIEDHNLTYFDDQLKGKQFDDCFNVYLNKNQKFSLVDQVWYELSENYLGSINQIDFVPYDAPFSKDMIHSWKSMISMILHRLRSPLTGVTGYLDLLPSNVKDEKTLEKINTIGLGIDKLTGLLEEIEELVKIEEKINTDNEVIDLESATYHLLEKFDELKDLNISIVNNQSDAVNTFRKNELNIIIQTLLENCAIHSDTSEEIKIEIRNNSILFSNKIPKDDNLLELDDILQPFKSSKADRMGLGLTLATILCQSLNGILVHSYNSNKSEFSIMLCLP